MRPTMVGLPTRHRGHPHTMLRSRSGSPLLRRALGAALLYLLAGQTDAAAQTRWNVDPKASLAWWQMSPNLNHLWATTCPEEPTWRPGEGRSTGWSLHGLSPSQTGYAGVADTINVPLYPRWEALPLCTEAVHGHVVVADPVTWLAVRGEVVVKAEALITGHAERDAYTRKAILETTQYKDIKFTIDSVVGVARSADTVRGTAVGMFTLRNVSRPMTAVVEAWPEAGGLRVLAKFRVMASLLTTDYGLSKYALGLGVGARIWHDLFMGADLLLHRDETPAKD